MLINKETVDIFIKILTLVVGLVTFSWGVIQFFINQKFQIETRRIEATKTFLDRQLNLYTEATKATSTIATSSFSEEVTLAKKRFWSLYWGELALVEDEGVETAMKRFGDALQNKSNQQTLQQLSLKLAHACRESLANSWGVKEWHKPQYRTH